MGRYTQGWLFAEDSGLEVDALEWRAWCLFCAICRSRMRPMRTNNRLVLERLGGRRSAPRDYVCVIALVHDGEAGANISGHGGRGDLLRASREHGFGYDPLFYYPPFGCSFGEVRANRKQDRQSSRSSAEEISSVSADISCEDILKRLAR